MRIEQIQYFKKLAETGSITAASHQLFISQQALSVAIKKLEEELSTKLFTRTSRGVILTPDGEYLLTECTKIIDTIEQIHVHFLAQNDTNLSLKIGAIPVIAKHILPKSISYFYKNLPNIQLDITVMSPESILESLCSQEIDLGFISEISLDEQYSTVLCTDLRFTPLFHLPFSIAMHKNHPLAKHRVLSFEQLADYPALILTYGDLENYLPHRILQYYNIDSTISVDNEILYNQMLEDGLGYSLYTQLSQKGQPPLDSSLVLRPLRENLFSTIGYVTRNTSDSKSAYLKIFCDHL